MDSTNELLLDNESEMQVLRYSLDIPVSLPTVSPSYVPQQLSRDTLNSVLDYLMDYLIDYLMFDVTITSYEIFELLLGM